MGCGFFWVCKLKVSGNVRLKINTPQSDILDALTTSSQTFETLTVNSFQILVWKTEIHVQISTDKNFCDLMRLLDIEIVFA